jgi:uncharacterized protein
LEVGGAVTPAFQIFADGADVTGNFNDRLLKLSVSDETGVESDKVEIELDNRGMAIATPRKGAVITVLMGYRETGLTLMGRYTVDEVEVEYAPSLMTVKGKSADLRKEMKEQKSRHFENTTFGDIIGRIARDHGLQPSIDPELASRAVKYFAQTEVSDLHVMTQLGRRHDALVAPKNGRLVAVRHGEGRTGSGRDVGALVITPPMVTKARGSTGDRAKHKEVGADFYDDDAAERKSIKVASVSEGPAMRLPHAYPSEDEARYAADTRGRELGRAEGSLTVEMPGRTDIVAEMPIVMEGFPDTINGGWIVSSAEHEISSSGFQTRFECGDDKKSGKRKRGGGGGLGENFYD